jgi:hypothetical protein
MNESLLNEWTNTNSGEEDFGKNEEVLRRLSTQQQHLLFQHHENSRQ